MSVSNINVSNSSSNIKFETPKLNTKVGEITKITYKNVNDTINFQNVESETLDLDDLKIQNVLTLSKSEYNTAVSNSISEIDKRLDELNGILEDLKSTKKSYEESFTYKYYHMREGNNAYGMNQTISGQNYTSLEYLDVEFKKDKETSSTSDLILSNFDSFSEFKEYYKNLENDIAVLESAIYKEEQLKKITKYEKMTLLEEYQNFEVNSSKVVYINYNFQAKKDNGSNISPYEFYKQAKELYGTAYNLPVKNLEIFDHLIEIEKTNPDMVKLYNYIYEKEGLEAANQYLEDMEDSINQQVGQVRAEDFLSTLSKNDDGTYDYASIVNHLKTSKEGIIGGVEGFFEGINAWFESSSTYDASEYEKMYILQALQENNDRMNFLDNNYEISQSIGNMLPSVAIGILTTPVGGAVSMGASAGGSSYHSALVEGHDKGTAIMYGVLSGASEALLERYLGKIPGMGEVNVTSFKTWLKSAGQEGFEEFVQQYVDAGMRNVLFDEEIDLKNVTQDALKSGVYGAITGGIMNSPALAINGINKAISDRNLSLQQDSKKNNQEAEVEQVRVDKLNKLSSIDASIANEQDTNVDFKTEEQSETVQNHSMSIMDTNFEIPKQIIEEQNQIITELVEKGFLSNSTKKIFIKDFIQYLFDNSEIISNLSTENLINLFSLKNHSYLREESIFDLIQTEIMSRLEYGESILEGNSLNYNIDFKGETKNTFSLSLFGQENIQKVSKQIEEKFFEFKQSNPDIMPSLTGLLRTTSVENFIKNFNNGIFNAEKIKTLSKIKEENKYTAVSLNYGIFADEIYSIGENFIMLIAKYPNISKKIIELNNANKNSMKIIQKVVNRYDGSSNYLYYQILEATVNYLYKNQNNLFRLENENIDNIINMGLQSKNLDTFFQISDIDNFIEKCDIHFKKIIEKNYKDIYELREIYLVKYYSLRTQDAIKLVNQYSEFSDDTIKEISNILKLNDFETLKNKYIETNTIKSSLDILKLKEDLRKKNSSTFVDKLNKTRNIIASLNKDNSFGSNEIELTGDFHLIVHSTDSGIIVKEKILSENVVDSWNNTSNPQNRLLSCSYIDNNNFQTAKLGNNGVLYAFTDIDVDDIEQFGVTDIHTRNEQLSPFSISGEFYASADNISSLTRRGYNEVAIKRTKPDYIVLFSDATQIQIQNAHREADAWKIPILKINKKDIVEKQITAQKDLLVDFTNNGNMENLKYVISSFESLANSFSLNMQNENEIITSTESLLILKQKELIEFFINDFINKSNQTQLVELASVIENEVEIYNKVNLLHSNSPASHSLLNLNDLLSKIQVKKEVK